MDAGSGAVPLRQTRTGRQRLKTAGTALALALLIGLVASYVILLRTGQASAKKTDFVPYYSAAHLVLSGHGGDIYMMGDVGRFERALVWPNRVKDNVMPYLYPSYFALALTPIAALPYTSAYLFWVVLSTALLLASVAALQRYAGFRGESALLFWVCTLSFLPVLVGLAQGQTSSLILALYTVTFLCLRSGRNVMGGCALGLALVKPTYVIPVLAVLVLSHRWRALAAFAATAAAVAVVPMLILGTSSATGFARMMLQALGWRKQIGGFEAQWNHSISGFTQLLLPGRVANALVAVASLAVVALFVRRAWTDTDFDVLFALAVVIGLLLSPHVLVHDLTLLLIPVAVSLRLRPTADRALPYVLAGGYAAVTVGLALVNLVPLQLSVPAMATLTLWLWFRSGKLDSKLGRVAATNDTPTTSDNVATIAMPKRIEVS